MTICAIGTPTGGRADCVVIHQIDNLSAIQARLARDPDGALFTTDIRQLRFFSRGLSNRGTLDAVDGNAFTGHGAEFLLFLANTQRLLQRASLDDPASIRPHFTPSVRDNLAAVQRHLQGLRCESDQVAVETAKRSQRGSAINTDAEDLAQVAESMNALAKEVFQPRSLIVLITALATTTIAMRVIRRWRRIRRRRAKRHTATYSTRYIVNDQEYAGMLIDINCHGTKLRHRADDPLLPGSAVDISVVEDWVSGTVMWSNTHYSGVQFKNSIGLGDVDIIRAQPEAG